MARVTSVAIVGFGKIAQDQHLPCIADNPAFRLAAISSQRGLAVDGVPTFHTPEEMIAALPDLDAIVICTPPQVHYATANAMLAAGKHVMLEKPPTATLSELHALAGLADERGRVRFTTWHSQYNAAVAAALVIGPGAVEKHVNSIFMKLGLAPTDSDHRRVLAVLAHVQHVGPAVT